MAGKLGSKRVDWTPFETEIKRLYLDEKLSARRVHQILASQGLKTSPGTLRGFITRRFGIRDLQGALEIRVYAEKICEHCGKSYEPTNSIQRWCTVCAPSKVWAARICRYGVSKPDWDRQLKIQGGTCALCDREPTVVDHCHSSMKTRGLLCNGCNYAVNRVEILNWVDRAAQYVRDGGCYAA